MGVYENCIRTFHDLSCTHDAPFEDTERVLTRFIYLFRESCFRDQRISFVCKLEAPVLAQYPRTMAEGWPFFFCARGRLARKKSKRTGGEMAIPIPRASKGILALKNTEVRELFRRRLRLWDALVALMPWLGVIRGMKKGKYFGKGFGG